MKHRERGFSLVELMVAMVITLIVSGAIYGLLASGQSAFRREPAVVDRQQNIRLALDLIRRDLEGAGVAMTPFAQVFTNGLDNPAPALGSAPSEIVPGNERADFLEILVNDGSCPALSVCGSPGGELFSDQAVPECIFGTPPRAGFGFVSGSGGSSNSEPGSGVPPGVLWITVPGPGAGGCGTGHVGLPAGQSGGINPGGNAACNDGGAPGTNNSATTLCQSISKVQFVRYELAPEAPGAAWDAIANPYSLWRSDYGRRNLDASLNNGPHTGANSPWQLIARGVEDMQVEYQTGAQWPATPGTWVTTPGDVTSPNYPTIVRRVRVTLSARAIGANLGGETQGATTAGRRGQLTTIVVPRSALHALAEIPPAPNPPTNPNPWR